MIIGGHRMDSIKHYFMKKDSPMEDLGSGIRRNILSYSDNLMLVEMHFEKGAIGSLHSHPMNNVPIF